MTAFLKLECMRKLGWGSRKDDRDCGVGIADCRFRFRCTMDKTGLKLRYQEILFLRCSIGNDHDPLIKFVFVK